MSERLFNLGILAVTVALLLVVFAAESAGVIDGDARNMIIGFIIGGGAGVSVGSPVRGKMLPQAPPQE